MIFWDFALFLWLELLYNSSMKTVENTNVKLNSTTENTTLSIERENELLKQRVEELEAKVNHYEELFRLSQHQKFGASSEKSDENQLSFFNEAEKESAKKHDEPITEELLVKRKAGRSKSRKTYEDLPVEEVYYSIAQSEQFCPNCDGPLHQMKTEVRKELKIIPAQVKVVHHIRQVYACRACELSEDGPYGTIVSASMPKPVLPGSMVSPSLLAFIMERKYNQHLPLYRQEQAFENFGIDISRQNMATWIMHGANTWLKLLYDRMHLLLKEERVIHGDESPLNVLDEKKNTTNYMWLYASAKTGKHLMYLYEYQPSRSNKHPKAFLQGFSGYLQTDGYQGYNSVEGVIQVGCMAHARRKFADALKALPENAEVSGTKANEGLALCNQIYHLEKQYAQLEVQGRYERRLNEMQPILDTFKAWLEEQKIKTLPKSKLGEAITYCLNQWGKLSAFMQDGHIAIDNNLAERAIKPFVLGRKNYLFAKSPAGAKASAMSYSIIETAKANGLNPFLYLNYLFEQLPNMDVTNPDALDALLPWAHSIPCEIRKSNNKQE